MVYLPVVLLSSAVMAGVAQVNRRRKGSDDDQHDYTKSHRRSRRRSSNDSYYDDTATERSSDELAAYARNSLPFPVAQHSHHRPYGQLMIENGSSALNSSGSLTPLDSSARRGSSGSHSNSSPHSSRKYHRSRHMSESHVEPFRGRGAAAQHFGHLQTERRSSNQEPATSRPYYVTYPNTGVSKATALGSHSRMKSPRNRWHATPDSDRDFDTTALPRKDPPRAQYHHTTSIVPYRQPQQINETTSQSVLRTPHLFENNIYSAKDFRRIWGSKHKVYADGNYIPILKLRHLGQRSSSVVEAVQHPKLPGFVLVHKYCHVDSRPNPLEHLQLLRVQAEKWSQLQHTHISTLLGTYETGISFSFLQHPVCQGNLASLLSSLGGKQLDEIDSCAELDLAVQFVWLKKWFGCLASALAYMHSQDLCHYNIKPDNIMYRKECIYLTDFGVATQFSKYDMESIDKSTFTTKRYAAPELLNNTSPDRTTDPIGSQSDIFSLGCIYLEMLAVIQGHSIANLHWFLNTYTLGPSFNPNHLPPPPSQVPIPSLHSPLESQGFIYSQAFSGVCEYFTHGDMTYDTMFEQGIKPMLSFQGSQRPSAKQVMGLLVRNQPWELVDCGCCDFGFGSEER